ncbi:MAG: penicillin-binding transpeptidase domain-containing protein [Gammaproteobacteria bacterium]|nr:penicillin-binding transpeptidase domain-containing protein [Gammaproteobacteria bacterium]
MMRASRPDPARAVAPRWRHHAVAWTFLLGVGALVLRAGYLVVTDREFLVDQGEARSIRNLEIPAHRGMIYDRMGTPLAVSAPMAAAWVDPTETVLAPGDAEALAAILELDAERIRARVDTARERQRRFAYIARRVEPDAERRVRALGIAGVYLQPEYHRFYPAGEVAAHLVGRTDIDDRGQEGIERAFNSVLSGEPGTKRVLRDLPGNTVKELLLDSPEDGDDLFLGLDLRLQFYAHRALGQAIKRHKARSGSVVMVDVASGDILALANQPSFNPNDWGARGVVVRNHALTDQFEPGSTVKPVTVLAALETGEYRGDTEIDTSPGWFRVGRKLIEDPLNRGVLTLAGVVAKSSQVGITKVALALEERAVFDALRRAGFGSSSITGLPEETAGFLTDRDLGHPIGRATIAYGYGLTVSAAQLAKVYLTLASGGVRRELNLLRDARPLPPERVFDAELVAEVVAMMRGVVAVGGTAPKASVAGYSVAGKTGTVRKVGSAGYDDSSHVAFFAGFAPAERPRVVAVVVINEPSGELIGGGSVAAPVFSRVVARTLRLLGVAPDEIAPRAEAVASRSPKRSDHSVENAESLALGVWPQPPPGQDTSVIRL